MVIEMKEKIIIFLVGLVLGSIISTGAIYVYTIANNKSTSEMDMPTGRGGMMENDGNPPEMPNEDKKGSI